LVYWWVDALPELLSGKSPGREVLHSVRNPLNAPMSKVWFREPIQGQILGAMRNLSDRGRVGQPSNVAAGPTYSGVRDWELAFSLGIVSP
jgi:hypothetical protein